MEEDILYTPEELASKLKLSKYTIYEMIKRGDIEAHRIGRSIRVSQSQLDLYMKGTGKIENIYDAEIICEGNAKFALTNGIRIRVSSDFEGSVKIAIRPEDIILSRDQFISSAKNIHQGIVSDIICDEKSAKIVLNIGISIGVLITKQSLVDMNIKKGDEFYATFKTMSVNVVK